MCLIHKQSTLVSFRFTVSLLPDHQRTLTMSDSEAWARRLNLEKLKRPPTYERTDWLEGSDSGATANIPDPGADNK
ncbi:Hypothetical predicted protein [Xyrichtys novacula]|uniref:Uncharacterized protein n=1 Tax=Xyrichtys novacula TaxID=13765 RepID=A0AAV1FGG3_XYRNO|nr:Hypothetical predicted protein [Xyrichtys novacula]